MEIGQDLRVNNADNFRFSILGKKVNSLSPLAEVAIPIAQGSRPQLLRHYHLLTFFSATYCILSKHLFAQGDVLKRLWLFICSHFDMALLSDYITKADEFSLQREAPWNNMKQTLLQFCWKERGKIQIQKKP